MEFVDLWKYRIVRMSKKPKKEIITFVLKGVKRNFRKRKFGRNSLSKETSYRILKTRRDESNFYFEAEGLAEEFKKRFDPKETIELAEMYLQGELEIFHEKIRFENWHTIKGVSWPVSDSGGINYYGKNRLDDIKFIWELNRMQFLPVIAKAYFLTGDERYAEKVIEYIETWIDQNPYGKGVNWMEGIEASVRLYSLIFSYYFIIGSSSLNEKNNHRVLESFQEQYMFIFRNLSDKWILNNNHIISELSCLIFTSVCFEEFKDSRKILDFSLKKLESEMDKQVFDDGCLWEHSTGYQKFVLDLVVYPLILLKKKGIGYPVLIDEKIRKMAGFLNDVSFTDGRIPLIGDEDQAFILKLLNEEYTDLTNTFAVVNNFLGTDFSHSASEHLFWLTNGLFIEKKGAKRKGEKFYPDGGYFVRKNNREKLIMVTSSQHKRYLHAAHRHLDMLSLIYEFDGKPIFIDPGTYTYFKDDDERNYFRNISSHSTAEVMDGKQFDLEGLFELRPTPATRIQISGDSLKASHEGYDERLERRLVFEKDHWEVHDTYNGDGRCRVNYILDPKVSIDIIDDYSMVLNDKVKVKSENKMELNNQKVSPGYNRVLMSKKISIEHIGKNITKIIPGFTDE